MNNNKNCHVTIRPDILKVILDATTPSNLARINAQQPCVSITALSKDQAGKARRDQARWDAHRTGDAYWLQVQSRTNAHSFRVQSYGKNAWQAVLRYYKGLDGGTWVWKCTKVTSATKI